MITVKEIFEKLTPDTERYLHICYDEMANGKLNDNDVWFDEFRYKMMGCLDCLVRQKVIVQDEATKLYQYFTDEFREGDDDE